MTVETFCTAGESERFKGGVHAAAGAIVGVMAVYNTVAWWYRRERHLGWNAFIYTAGFAWEVYQTSRHLRRPSRPSLDTFRTPALVGDTTARFEQDADPCQCGEGFCWCGGAESNAVGFAAASSSHLRPERVMRQGRP